MLRDCMISDPLVSVHAAAAAAAVTRVLIRLGTNGVCQHGIVRLDIILK